MGPFTLWVANLVVNQISHDWNMLFFSSFLVVCLIWFTPVRFNRIPFVTNHHHNWINLLSTWPLQLWWEPLEASVLSGLSPHPGPGLGISLDPVSVSGLDVATLQKANLGRYSLVVHWPQDQITGLSPISKPQYLNPKDVFVIQRHYAETWNKTGRLAPREASLGWYLHPRGHPMQCALKGQRRWAGLAKQGWSSVVSSHIYK